jgi:glycosyltransferase involved in cell wall biosynthesis
MKLGFYSSNWTMPWGASEELWSQAAQLLQEQGHSVVVNYKWWPNCPERLAEIQHAGGFVFWRGQSQVKDSRSNESWLEKVEPEFVLITLGWHLDDITIAQACLERQIPYAINLRVANKIDWITDDNLDQLREVFLKAKACFFITPYNREIMETQLALRLPHAKLAPSPFAVRSDACPPWPDTDKGWVLACVGRLHLPSKGQDLILTLFSLDKWRQRSIRVAFWGADQHHKKQLRDLVDLYKLHDKVTFCGFTQDVEKIWAEHHALLLPSRYEGGMPLATVEAMVCGRLPIVTKCAGALVDDNETGFIAAAPTVELLDETMERAWAQREKWQEIGKLAAHRIREKYPSNPVEDFAMQIETLATEAHLP